MTHANEVASLERKFSGPGVALEVRDTEVEGYASIFDIRDQSGDVVSKGAYANCLKQLARNGRKVRMLWQHDQGQPIGVWDEIREDGRGLYVKGRILPEVQKGHEALVLLEAGAIDGLSIGYRTKQAERRQDGARILTEIELWEVSVVTFPMLPEARVQAGDTGDSELAQDLVEAFAAARQLLA